MAVPGEAGAKLEAGERTNRAPPEGAREGPGEKLEDRPITPLLDELGFRGEGLGLLDWSVGGINRWLMD